MAEHGPPTPAIARTRPPTPCSTATRSRCSSGCCSTSSSRWSGRSPGRHMIAQRLGVDHLDPAAIAGADPEAFAALMARPRRRCTATPSMAGAGPGAGGARRRRVRRRRLRLWRTAGSGAELLARLRALPGFGDAKVADLRRAARASSAGSGRRAGRRRPAPTPTTAVRSVADVVDAASLQEVRDHKRALKQAARQADPGGASPATPRRRARTRRKVLRCEADMQEWTVDRPDRAESAPPNRWRGRSQRQPALHHAPNEHAPTAHRSLRRQRTREQREPTVVAVTTKGCPCRRSRPPGPCPQSSLTPPSRTSCARAPPAAASRRLSCAPPASRRRCRCPG